MGGEISRASTLEGQTALAAIVGGTASELGGGKFANGAVTGAFVHMYNAMGHTNKYTKILERGKISLKNNMAIAKKISLSVFIDNVKSGGKWDYKNNPFLRQGISLSLYSSNLLQEFGNYHFGIVANSFGFGLEISMSGAGFYQVVRQGGGNSYDLPSSIAMGVLGGLISDKYTNFITNQNYSWADNQGDAKSIMQGWNYANGL